MKYIELKITSDRNNTEKLIEYLNSKNIFIYEEYGEQIYEELKENEKSWDFIDDDIFKTETGKILLKIYFSPKEHGEYEKLKMGIEAESLGEVTIEEQDDEDWANNWKKYYHVIEIGENIAIKPHWESYDNIGNRAIVEIDPGMAFGTGMHETTYLCIEAIEKYIKKGDKIFDIGCGSGILGITALKLGASSAFCVDIDENCIIATNNNKKLNNIGDELLVHKGNLLDVVKGKANIIISNIIAEVISEMVLDLNNHLEKDGIFIFSGIIKEKMEFMKHILKKQGMEILEIKEKNEWVLIVGKRNV
ncbi:ribosomal protein L11 methyltransferase [Peptoniphilus sp. ING2-D1G]|nr:ribosomal protein L11 methyltransferase [Peptoniphilus sp. ING2-D1G]